MFLHIHTILALTLWVILLPISYSHEQKSSQTIFYGGIGHSLEDRSPSNASPWTIGLLHKSHEQQLSWGVDISQEGTLVDSENYRYQSITQGTSLNIVATGKPFQDIDVDIGALFGIRYNCSECYYGYYYDGVYYDSTDDDTQEDEAREDAVYSSDYADYPYYTGYNEYTYNFGVISFYSFEALPLILGLRITTVSQQLILGINF